MDHAWRYLILALCLGCTAAAAQPTGDKYPEKTVRIIMPFQPGGPTDLNTRYIAQKLSEAWNHPVIVENRPGANGLVGEEYAAKSTPDGYTLMATSTGFAINPFLYKMPYDPVRDFTPVTQFVSAWQLVVVNNELPAKSIQELIDVAKSKPGGLNAASYGIGSSAHLAMELMSIKAGIKMTHVPYPNFPKAATDLMTGRVHLLIPTLGSVLPFVKSGKVRALAVTSPQRLAFIPDVPTVAEAGIPGYDAVTWVGMFAPSGTPAPIVSKISAEVSRILKMPEVKAYFEARGDVPIGSTPEEFKRFVGAEMEKYSSLVKAANVKVE